MSNPITNGNGNAAHVDADFDVIEWSATLSKANITNWGGMISTPAELLQEMIRKTLIELHCPPQILDELIDNSHERNWPAGLNTLATRQNSRPQYDNYICKRVPGMQAVVVLHCDNAHMPENMILKPGIVMAFAYGVE